METLSRLLPAGNERAVRIGRVKFIALPLEEEPPVQPSAPASRFQRFLQRIRLLASRVDGRPMAARP